MHYDIVTREKPLKKLNVRDVWVLELSICKSVVFLPASVVWLQELFLISLELSVSLIDVLNSYFLASKFYITLAKIQSGYFIGNEIFDPSLNSHTMENNKLKFNLWHKWCESDCIFHERRTKKHRYLPT